LKLKPTGSSFKVNINITYWKDSSKYLNGSFTVSNTSGSTTVTLS
jgi:hypothetical protein